MFHLGGGTWAGEERSKQEKNIPNAMKEGEHFGVDENIVWHM